MTKKQPETIIHATICQHARDLQKLALRVHANPEQGFHEVKAAAWQAELLKRWHFRVRAPIAGVQTAFRAESGVGKPVFCFMSEYDALPDLGHGCGHNLICAAALGAGVALARALQAEKRRGTVVVLGTPAEESFGGKVVLLKKGAMRGLDAAIMAHPSYRTTPDAGCSAITRFQVFFTGKAAHAAAAPERGCNALDAVMLMFHGINAWRQQLPESSRIHGIVDNGGVKPNIIPDKAACSFYLRSPSDTTLAAMTKRFYDIAHGAALMTGTKVAVKPWLEPYKTRRPNQFLNDAFLDEAEQLGLNPVRNISTGRASTDFGDVSHAMPGVHIYFGIAQKVIAAHSVDFCQAAATPYALKQMLLAAEAMARVGYRYLADIEFRAKVNQAFKAANKA